MVDDPPLVEVPLPIGFAVLVFEDPPELALDPAAATENETLPAFCPPTVQDSVQFPVCAAVIVPVITS